MNRCDTTDNCRGVLVVLVDASFGQRWNNEIITAIVLSICFHGGSLGSPPAVSLSVLKVTNEPKHPVSHFFGGSCMSRFCLISPTSHLFFLSDPMTFALQPWHDSRLPLGMIYLNNCWMDSNRNRWLWTSDSLWLYKFKNLDGNRVQFN